MPPTMSAPPPVRPSTRYAERIARDTLETVQLHRDIGMIQDDVNTRVGIGAADVQRYERNELEHNVRTIVYYRELMSSCLEHRNDDLKLLVNVEETQRDYDLPGQTARIKTMEGRWATLRDTVVSLIKTETYRITNESVSANRHSEELYSLYVDRVKQAESDIKRLQTDISVAMDGIERGEKSLKKRKTIAADMAIRRSRHVEFRLLGAVERASDVRFDTDDFNVEQYDDANSSLDRVNRWRSTVSDMKSRVAAFKYRDGRGLYRNIVFVNGRYRWSFCHHNRQYASRVSFYHVEQAVMSLMNAKAQLPLR